MRKIKSMSCPEGLHPEGLCLNAYFVFLATGFTDFFAFLLYFLYKEGITTCIVPYIMEIFFVPFGHVKHPPVYALLLLLPPFIPHPQPPINASPFSLLTPFILRPPLIVGRYKKLTAELVEQFWALASTAFAGKLNSDGFAS